MATATKTRKPHTLNREQVTNVKRWIKALRSGEFRQAKEQLKKDAGYCCLGVACVVTRTRFKATDGGLPPAAMKKIGLRDDQGYYEGPDGELSCLGEGRSLVDHNDEDNWSFKRIARFVEQQLKTNSRGLFPRPE